MLFDKKWVVNECPVILMFGQRWRPKVGSFAVKAYSAEVMKRQHRLKLVVMWKA